MLLITFEPCSWDRATILFDVTLFSLMLYDVQSTVSIFAKISTLKIAEKLGKHGEV
jgi:hypothetical protein